MDCSAVRELMETLMMICFGMAWPIAIMKSWRSRSNKGKSILFICVILTGYICGITGKIVSNNMQVAFIAYLINTAMVLTDIGIWFRNRKLDKPTEQNS